MRHLFVIVFSLFLIVSIAEATITQQESQFVGSADVYSVNNALQDAIQRVWSRTTKPSVPQRDYITIIGIGKDEKLDYASQNFVHFEIAPIDKDLQLKQNLSVNQYDLLVTGWLNSIYINKFRNNVWALKYFARALAEYAYAYNGYIDSDFYEEVIARYNIYLQIDSEIRELEIISDIKYSLAKLYAAECIYNTEIDSSKYELEKISKIPKDAILYHMEEQAGELLQEGKFSDAEAQDKTDTEKNLDKQELGNFVGYNHGVNLYYVCLAYYPKFKDLAMESQIKIINDIYSYNPTLMEAPSIKRNRYAWSLLLDWISPKPNPQVMKYCLKPYCNWVILPKTI